MSTELEKIDIAFPSSIYVILYIILSVQNAY